MLALSTSWNVDFKKSGNQVAREIRDIGFDCVELCFYHTEKDLEQITKLQNQKKIKVLSLHNYCPIPDNIPRVKALPDVFSLSSLNSSECKKAIFFTKRTILFAKKIKAKAVVLHTGRVEIQDYTKKLVELKRSNKQNSCEFQSIRKYTIKERRLKKQLFLDNVFRSLKELTDFAYNEGVALGLENRIYIREIPNYEEIKIFLESFHKKGLRYWHDTGHSYILEQLGFTKQINYLKSYNEYLAGIHLHDVKNLCDHKAPFTGEINFKSLKPYIKKNTIKIIEVHRPATAKEIIIAKQKLEKLFN